MVRSKNKEIEIEKCLDARKIIEFSEKNGLEDIRKWTDIKKIQYLLNCGEWIGYIAKLSNELDEQLLIGTILGSFEEEGRLWIELINVAKQYRKRGVGRMLIEKLSNLGKKMKFRACFVDVDDDNFNAINFYKKMGFKYVGKIEYFYYNDQNAIIFMKRI